jgi:hypothetical protein
MIPAKRRGPRDEKSYCGGYGLRCQEGIVCERTHAQDNQTYLALHCEQCQSDKHTDGDQQRLADYPTLVVARHRPNEDALTRRKQAKEDEIGWVFMSFPPCPEEGNE